jgi:NAD(P)H-hydrate epimerase
LKYPEIKFPQKKALELSDFRDMDYFAIKNFKLPIELMMENAGLHLASLISNFASKEQSIRIGIGNGNNGGGGLVAARRLVAWGYQVHVDLFVEITKELPSVQLERALKFGAKISALKNPDFWVDAYLGFSQRLPLSDELSNTLEEANNSKAVKISLDIPTGFIGNKDKPYFRADKILTLAAPKKILYNLQNTEIYVADLGIPLQVYEMFDIDFLPFNKGAIIKLIT